MSIIDIILKKTEKEDNSQALIGTEIKLRRNALSKTLEEISADTCSVSYLSKLENCEIKGNPVFLEEICKKVRLTNDNIKSIKQSREIFENAIRCIYNKDEDGLKGYYDQIFDLKNYRAKMIKLMYSLYHSNMRVSKRLLEELSKVEASMQLNDLIILAYLESWYYYLNNEYYDAFLLLKPLVPLTVSYRFLDSLCLELIVDIEYTVNSHLFMNYAQVLRENYLKHNSFDKINILESKVDRFYLNNGYISLVLDRIKNNSVIPEDSRILYSAFEGERISFNWDEYNYPKMIYLYTFNKELFKSIYESKKIKGTNLELMTLALLFDKEFDSNFERKLFSFYYPFAIQCKNYFLIKYVTFLMSSILKKKSRYKKDIQILEEFYSIEKEREFYC